MFKFKKEEDYSIFLQVIDEKEKKETIVFTMVYSLDGEMRVLVGTRKHLVIYAGINTDDMSYREKINIDDDYEHIYISDIYYVNNNGSLINPTSLSYDGEVGGLGDTTSVTQWVYLPDDIDGLWEEEEDIIPLLFLFARFTYPVMEIKDS